MQRKLTLKPNDKISPCPKCGNNTIFTLRAEQFSEDCCETCVVCKCGHEPAGETGNRYENVWGECDDAAACVALSCWNAALAA